MSSPWRMLCELTKYFPPALIFVGVSLGIGVLLLSYYHGFASAATSILFGQILGDIADFDALGGERRQVRGDRRRLRLAPIAKREAARILAACSAAGRPRCTVRRT